MVKEISIKSILSILATKFTLFLTKTILKGGTTFPGRVALKLDSNILATVSKGYKVGFSYRKLMVKLLLQA